MRACLSWSGQRCLVALAAVLVCCVLLVLYHRSGEWTARGASSCGNVHLSKLNCTHSHLSKLTFSRGPAGVVLDEHWGGNLVSNT